MEGKCRINPPAVGGHPREAVRKAGAGHAERAMTNGPGGSRARNSVDLALSSSECPPQPQARSPQQRGPILSKSARASSGTTASRASANISPATPAAINGCGQGALSSAWLSWPAFISPPSRSSPTPGPPRPAKTSRAHAGLSTSVWSFLLFVMLSGGLVRALVVLHEQDDSSLLLSSPVSPRAILARPPFRQRPPVVSRRWLHHHSLHQHPYFCLRHSLSNFLWGYAVWFALAIIVTCIDGLFSFGLIRWLRFAPRPFLFPGHPFLLIFGVTFFAGTLSVSVAQIESADQAHMPPEMQAQFIALTHTPLVWIAWRRGGPVRSIWLLIFFTPSCLALITLAPDRARVYRGDAASRGEHRARPGPATADAPFRTGVLRLEVRKNLRLIVRTPMMMVQCLAQALMPIGIACVLGREDLALAVAFFTIFAAGVLSGMFTIAAGTVEECDDLLPCRRSGARIFRYGKMLSGCLWPLGARAAGRPGTAAGRASSCWPLAVLFARHSARGGFQHCGGNLRHAGQAGHAAQVARRPDHDDSAAGHADHQRTRWRRRRSSLRRFVAGRAAVELLAAYLLLVMAIGLAQLRKPLSCLRIQD